MCSSDLRQRSMIGLFVGSCCYATPSLTPASPLGRERLRRPRGTAVLVPDELSDAQRLKRDRPFLGDQGEGEDGGVPTDRNVSHRRERGASALRGEGGDGEDRGGDHAA